VRRLRPRGWRLGVDLRSALGLVGLFLAYLSLSMLVPIAVAIGYGEPVSPFVITGLVTGGGGLLLHKLMRGGHGVGAREGFLVVALTWLAFAGLGSLPYMLSGEEQLSHPIDAYFEAMSGFTTTGASVLHDIDEIDRSVLMWRQFTQWLGGMGIIVLALAVLPRLRVGGRQLLESELPGPEIEPLAARIRDIARRLWLLYVGLTALEIAVLLAVGWLGIDERMTPFHAIAHGLTTLPTGGFSTQDSSFVAFGAASQWVVIAFMVVAGMNFALLYRAFSKRRPGTLFRDEELRLYIGLMVIAAAVLGVELLSADLAAGEEAVRHAVFQAVSLMTGTGFASHDFATWTALAATTLVGLMFIGGSAGSTTGSVKVVRHLLLGKILRRELDQTVHPELVARVRLNRAPVDERTVRAISSFVLLYIGLFAVGSLLLMADAARVGLHLTPFEAVSAAAATLGNVGPAFGPAGPMESYEPFSDLSKLVMIGLMWLGRLEIIPVVVLLTRNYWRA
jgi:trk system potassium uptake protein TrkH